MRKLSIITYPLSIHSGFTLIEILLVVSLSVTISLVSIIGFTQFNSLQQVNNAASEVTSLLQQAKSHTISQVKPQSVAACNTNSLGGYEVRLCGLPGSTCAGTGTYNLYVICGGSNLVKTATLPSGVAFVNGSTTAFTFRILNGSVTPGTIQITGSGKTRTIQVSPIGSISMQ
jgi:type II secretory pathway pseudopilin PulG